MKLPIPNDIDWSNDLHRALYAPSLDEALDILATNLEYDYAEVAGTRKAVRLDNHAAVRSIISSMRAAAHLLRDADDRAVG